MTCGNCSAETLDSNAFCDQCGARLPAMEKPPAKKPAAKWLGISAIGLGIFLIGKIFGKALLFFLSSWVFPLFSGIRRYFYAGEISTMAWVIGVAAAGAAVFCFRKFFLRR